MTVSKSLVLTVIGNDRPGIVNKVSDVARKFDANWAGSRMASLAGQFAGIVHFQVPDEKADALAEAFRALDSSALHVVVNSPDAAAAPGAQRIVRLGLVGNDRPGIVRDLSGSLVRRGVSIEELHTEIVSGAMSGEQMFQAKALLRVPAGLATDELRRVLEGLANELMVDIALDDAATRLAATP